MSDEKDFTITIEEVLKEMAQREATYPEVTAAFQSLIGTIIAGSGILFQEQYSAAGEFMDLVYSSFEKQDAQIAERDAEIAMLRETLAENVGDNPVTIVEEETDPITV